MKCTVCFAENPDSAIFCENCGNALIPSTPAPSSGSSGFMSAPADLNAPTTYGSAPARSAGPAPGADPVAYSTPSYDAPPAHTPSYSGSAYHEPSYSGSAYREPSYSGSAYREPTYSTPPASRYSPAPDAYRRAVSGETLNRKPPLPGALVAVVAAICTLILFLNIYNAVEGMSGPLGSLMSALKDLGGEFRGTPLDDVSDFLRDISDAFTGILLFACLFELGTVIGMWLTFGGCIGSTVRPTFSAGLKIIKVMRIFYAIFAIAIAAIAATFCVISAIALLDFPYDEAKIAAFALFFVGTGYFVFTILYHSSIMRTLNNMRLGAITGEYGPASGFLIFCLFASAVLAIIGIYTKMDGNFYDYYPAILYTDLSAIVIPILEGVGLCIYNSKR